MNNTKHILFKKLFSSILIIGIFTVVYNSIVFGHFHLNEFNKIYYHFHPFNSDFEHKEPIKSHQHTENEILQIGQYNISLVSLAIVLFFTLYLLVKILKNINLLKDNNVKLQSLQLIPPLRSPPLFNY